jgi:RNAse (barnase) inhibitor barstar
VIDGEDFDDFSGFLCAMGEAVNGPRGYFGADLQSFDDCLFGGFGLEAPCRIRWRNAARSRERLGPAALVAELETSITWIDEQDDPEDLAPGRAACLEGIELAKRGDATLLDHIVGYIESARKRAHWMPAPGIVVVLE